MKKTLLIIALVLCIFQMVVLATAIDIGSPAINRATWASSATIINRTNPANLSGIITSVQTYAEDAMTGVSFATFYHVDNVFTTRDHVDIGNVAAGYVNTAGLELEVEAGDYIGIYFTSGGLDWDETGGGGRWRLVADQIPCEDVDFGVPNEVYHYSLAGIGATVDVGIEWNGITITKWNGITITKINGK